MGNSSKSIGTAPKNIKSLCNFMYCSTTSLILVVLNHSYLPFGPIGLKVFLCISSELIF